MKFLLISGSRDIPSNAARLFLEKTIRQALDERQHIWTGDAFGVDKLVAEIVAAIDPKFSVVLTVFGIQEKPRHAVTHPSIEYRNIRLHAINPADEILEASCPVVYDYASRDKYMVNRVNAVVCVWNGCSKGTKAVYEYAETLGIPRHLELIDNL